MVIFDHFFVKFLETCGDFQFDDQFLLILFIFWWHFGDFWKISWEIFGNFGTQFFTIFWCIFAAIFWRFYCWILPNFESNFGDFFGDSHSRYFLESFGWNFDQFFGQLLTHWDINDCKDLGLFRILGGSFDRNVSITQRILGHPHRSFTKNTKDYLTFIKDPWWIFRNPWWIFKDPWWLLTDPW